jgi:hypothetical protein
MSNDLDMSREPAATGQAAATTTKKSDEPATLCYAKRELGYIRDDSPCALGAVRNQPLFLSG